MFEKFARSWRLVKASARVIEGDRKLLLFPLLSGIAALVVVASFAIPMIALGRTEANYGEGSAEGPGWIWKLLFYIVLYCVMFFFNAALVAAALVRLRGGEPSVNGGLRIAFARVGAIFGYAVIAATVGLLLRMLEERLSIVGRFVIGVIGIAWTVATFLTVPVLVSGDAGPIAAVKESAGLLRRSWGENVIGNASIGLVFAIFWIVLAIAAFAVLMGPAISTGGGALAITLFAVLAVIAVLLALIQSALQGVYSAALYRYAAEGGAGGGFDAGALADAFRPKP